MSIGEPCPFNSLGSRLTPEPKDIASLRDKVNYLRIRNATMRDALEKIQTKSSEHDMYTSDIWDIAETTLAKVTRR